MFWTLTNDIIDSRKAVKDFPVIAAGGTFGAILISFAIPGLLKVFSAQSLVGLWAGLVFCIALIFIPMNKLLGKQTAQYSDSMRRTSFTFKNIQKGITLLRSEPLLSHMAILYFLIFFVLLNQHYLFYGVIKTQLGDASTIAGFLGFFNGFSMILTFILQVTIAGLIIKRIGSTRSMFLLPVAFSLVFTFLLILSLKLGVQSIAAQMSNLLFFSVVCGVGLRVAFFDAFFSPNFQLFFSSLPQEIRGRGKLAIEGIVKPSAMIVASLWLLGVTSRVSFAVNISVLLLLSLGMIVQTLRIRKKYTQSLTQYLRTFSSNLKMEDVSQLASSSEGLAVFKKLIQTEPFEVVCYLVEIVCQSRSNEAIAFLKDISLQVDTKVRAVIVAALGTIQEPSLKSFFIEVLKDNDERVIANAITSLANYDEPEVDTILLPFLKHGHNRIRANTIVALGNRTKESVKRECYNELKRMLFSEDKWQCASALYAVSELYNDSSVTLAFESCFNKKRDAIIADRNLWRQCLRVISKGVSNWVVFDLVSRSSKLNSGKRREMVNAVSLACKNGFSSETLADAVDATDSWMTNTILKIIANSNTRLSKEQEDAILTLANQEAQRIDKRSMAVHCLTSQSDSESIHLLAEVISEEHITTHIDTIMCCAILLDTSGQVKSIVRRLRHENQHTRAQALEVLDNTGNTKVNRLITAFYEHSQQQRSPLQLKSKTNGQSLSISSIIEEYCNDQNQWVRECALFAKSSIHQ